jgi:hypothetical protein
VIQTTISDKEPVTGSQLLIPVEILNRVKHASALLETELDDVAKKFPVEARWQFLQRSDRSLGLQLDLTAQGAGIKEYPLPLETYHDDASILRSLRTPVWHFSRALSDVVKWDLERIRRDLDTLSSDSGE